jgi:HEPN domain-containing protein
MKNSEKVMAWLRRAQSNLAFAQAGPLSSEILYEDLCFNAQQAAEKALKAFCIAAGVAFPKTHDLGYLIELLERAGILLPEELQLVKVLTDYAVGTRYPGNYDPVTVEEYRAAAGLAGELLAWVRRELGLAAP